MTANTSAPQHATSALTEEEQAAALWTFVQLKVGRFTSEAAREIVRNVGATPGDAPKRVAKRLRQELAQRGVALKHTAALHAAARLLGYASWHAAADVPPTRGLKFLSTSADRQEQLLADWRDAVPALRDECDRWLAQCPNAVFQLRFTATALILSARNATAAASARISWTPLAAVNASANESTWLDGAPAALESVRRHLEENDKAVLDGIAALQLIEADRKLPMFVFPKADLNDVCNAELILLREDDELNSGYEIARGDEMTCWAQFELAIKDHATKDVVLDGGAWRVGGGRYIWQLSTLRPKDIVPGLSIRELGERDSAKLYRRYKLAKRIAQRALDNCEQTKRIEYLGSVAETYRVDLHRLLLAMNKAGMTWESYCAQSGEAQPMVPELPVGFVLALAERLQLEDPNSVFARPTRSELARVDDDKLLRALLPRIDHVRYRLRAGVATEIKAAVRDAVEDFSASIRMRQLQAGGNFIDAQSGALPYLVYASDGEELRQRLDDLGLVMFAGVMPHLFSTKGIVEPQPNVWPFAIGNSLFLDIDVDDQR